MCIESVYNLSSPLINPFSNLRHNPVELGGKKGDSRLLEHCLSVLNKHTSVDRKLIPYLNKKFSHLVNSSSITQQDLLVRKLFHSSPLFDYRWFKLDGSVKSPKVYELVVNSIATRYSKAGELGDSFSLLFSWHAWRADSKEKVISLLSDKISMGNLTSLGL